MDKNLIEEENKTSHEDYKAPNHPERWVIDYIAQFKTFDELLRLGNLLVLDTLETKIESTLPKNKYIKKIADIKLALVPDSSEEIRQKAKKHYEECKTLAEKYAPIDREKKRQELQVSIINQAEDCLKIFKRYLDFLNDKDYIKLEKIKSSTEQFIEIYEKLFDLAPETPKKLGSLFRSVKIAFNLILFLENNLAYHLIDFNKKELEGNIEIIEAEILRWREYFRMRGVL